jgi:hypothetical protein
MYVYDPYGFPVRIPRDLLQALGEHTGEFRCSLDLEPIICEAIHQYMNPPLAPAPEVAPPSAAPAEAGYQWKEVFLPAGTKLRANFNRAPYFAIVDGTHIKYGDYAISPSCFANLHGSGNRNAWAAIWLRLPGSDDWLLAQTWRLARKAVIARLFDGAPPQARQPARAESASAASSATATTATTASPMAITEISAASAISAALARNASGHQKRSRSAARRKRRAAKQLAAKR